MNILKDIPKTISQTTKFNQNQLWLKKLIFFHIGKKEVDQICTDNEMFSVSLLLFSCIMGRFSAGNSTPGKKYLNVNKYFEKNWIIVNIFDKTEIELFWIRLKLHIFRPYFFDGLI